MNIQLNRNGGESLTAQLFRQLRNMIHSGKLQGNSKLPSTRDLAGDLGISRNIVLEVYDQLYAEGYVQSRRGDGTYVSEGISFRTPDPPDRLMLKKKGFKPFNSSLIDFRSGLPDLSALPIGKWLTLSRRVYMDADPLTFAYGQPEGTEELRTAIAAYISVYRGVNCHPGQIIITGGTTQAVGLVSDILLQGERKTVCLEDPVTADIQKIVLRLGGRIEAVPVDGEGMNISCLKDKEPPAFAYVTPSHQYPLGVTMSIRRRIELIKDAGKRNYFVLEDDYDSEYRYDVNPVPALQGLDPERVIYLGTFSKTLFPALRIGYIVFPRHLIEEGRERKWFTDLHNPVMDQLVLARFIGEGHFVRFIAKMKKRHQTKRKFLLDCLKKAFGQQIEILGNAVGIHVAVRFPGMVFDEDFLKELESRGVRVYPAEEHAIIKGAYKDTVILGFGFLSREKMEQGIKLLSAAISERQ